MTRRLFAVSRGTLLLAGPHDPEDHVEWLTRIVGEAEARRIVQSEYRGHYSPGEIHVYVGEGCRELSKTHGVLSLVKTVATVLKTGPQTLVFTGVAGDQWRPFQSWGALKDLK